MHFLECSSVNFTASMISIQYTCVILQDVLLELLRPKPWATAGLLSITIYNFVTLRAVDKAESHEVPVVAVCICACADPYM